MAQYLHTTWPPRVKIGLKGQEQEKSLGEGAGYGPVPSHTTWPPRVKEGLKGQHQEKGLGKGAVDGPVPAHHHVSK